MAYDRYDTRDAPRDERSRWSSERDRGRWSGEDRGQGRWSSEDRGFFERAGDEVASWFGDEEAERRRERDRRMAERERGFGGGYGGNYSRERVRSRDLSDRGRFDRDEGNRGWFGSSGYRGTGGESGMHGPMWSTERFDSGESRYRPMIGSDYGRSESFYGEPGPRGDFERHSGWREREPYGRDEMRRTSYSGSDRGGDFDPHYHSWRQRQVHDLDRDYDEFRRENQARFEDEFTSWRQRRQQKRGLLGQIREHMEVVGNDEEHVGTVDRVAGDRIILTKSDPESGGVHHSLSCSEIDRVEADRVILDCSAEQARHRWRDESRSRALFEREDQGEMGPRALDRSFEGTYR
jgi:hypothetical protein